jgi:hypothetical protein
VKCPKCGLVSFAVDGVCKRCGAKLEPSSAGSAPAVSRGAAASVPQKSYNGLLIGGGFLSFILGVIGFGATENKGVALALSLFFGVFVVGVIASFLLVDFLKNRNAPRERATSDAKSGKVLIYPLIMFVVLLPVALVKLGPNVEANELGQAIGRLVGSCFIPAIITGIWINKSRKQWSWPGAGLRYLLFFVIFSVVALYGSK